LVHNSTLSVGEENNNKMARTKEAAKAASAAGKPKGVTKTKSVPALLASKTKPKAKAAPKPIAECPTKKSLTTLRTQVREAFKHTTERLDSLEETVARLDALASKKHRASTVSGLQPMCVAPPQVDQ